MINPSKRNINIISFVISIIIYSILIIFIKEGKNNPIIDKKLYNYIEYKYYNANYVDTIKENVIHE